MRRVSSCWRGQALTAAAGALACADYVHRTKVLADKAFARERLSLTRDVSKLKSQILLANSRQGRLVRSERLRLTRSGSVAGGAALLELTQDNIMELGQAATDKVRKHDHGRVLRRWCCSGDLVPAFAAFGVRGTDG